MLSRKKISIFSFKSSPKKIFHYQYDGLPPSASYHDNIIAIVSLWSQSIYWKILGKNGGIQRPQYLCIIDMANFETDFGNILILIQIFVNTGLIYGATKRYQWLFIPWMLIYLPAILALLIFCSIQFAVLEGQQLSAILLVIVSSYFYAIVVSSYIELKLQNKILKVNGN